MNPEQFRSERISRTSAITLDGSIERVFPLFGAVEERKWAEGFEPVVLYPPSEQIEAGMTFTTPASNASEERYTWTVSQYEPEHHRVQYTVWTANRVWTITIQCRALPGSKTDATVTYMYTGLNTLGNRLNAEAMATMYRDDLRDWRDQIDHFLKMGSMLKHHA
jgi:polyketide cyclase/dehydrase/lipid transport protein